MKIGLFLAFVFWVTSASAHSWYTGTSNELGEVCCGGSDCAAIPEEDVTPMKGGYLVHVPDFKGQPIEAWVPNARARPAKEGGDYHLCYYSQQIKCFFYPAPAY